MLKNKCKIVAYCIFVLTIFVYSKSVTNSNELAITSKKINTIDSVANKNKLPSDSITESYIKYYKNNVKNFNYSYKNKFKPKNGFVPNDTTAIKIAEAIWLPIYGKTIYDSKPFIAVLIKGQIWRVVGVLPPGYNGGTPIVEIRKSDGKIIYVSHDK